MTIAENKMLEQKYLMLIRLSRGELMLIRLSMM